MTRANLQEWATGVNWLSLILALLLFASVAMERNGETTLSVPVYLGQLPAGLKVVSPAPAPLVITVSGPRIVLWRLRFREIRCHFDLTGFTAGPVTLTPLEGSFRLDRELKLVRISPASVRLTLAKETPG
jgi:YbbR domain-containing protein